MAPGRFVPRTTQNGQISKSIIALNDEYNWYMSRFPPTCGLGQLDA